MTQGRSGERSGRHRQTTSSKLRSATTMLGGLTAPSIWSIRQVQLDGLATLSAVTQASRICAYEGKTDLSQIFGRIIDEGGGEAMDERKGIGNVSSSSQDQRSVADPANEDANLIDSRGTRGVAVEIEKLFANILRHLVHPSARLDRDDRRFFPGGIGELTFKVSVSEVTVELRVAATKQDTLL